MKSAMLADKYFLMKLTKHNHGRTTQIIFA